MVQFHLSAPICCSGEGGPHACLKNKRTRFDSFRWCHIRSLTQLDRVPVFETGSRGFESCRTGHIKAHLQIRPIVREIATNAEGLFKSVLLYGVLSVVVCTSRCDREGMSSILIDHPKQCGYNSVGRVTGF